MLLPVPQNGFEITYLKKRTSTWEVALILGMLNDVRRKEENKQDQVNWLDLFLIYQGVKGWCYIRQNVLKYGFPNFPAILLRKAFGFHPVSFFPSQTTWLLPNLQTILSIFPWSTQDNKISDVTSGRTYFYKCSVVGPSHMVRNAYVIQRPESSGFLPIQHSP